MTNNPSVSVIIPVFNQESYIKECLDSVLRQDLADFEVICINDGSTDSSLAILEEYASKDNRVQLFDQENMGVGATRNKGISLARGEYVIFCDPDDFYPDDQSLKALYEAGKANGALVVAGCFSDYDTRNGKINDDFDGMLYGYTFKKPGWIDYLDYQFDYGFHRFLINRQMLLNNEIKFPEYARFQDPPFLVRALYCAKRIYAIDKVVYRYRYGHTRVKWNKVKRLDLCRGLRDNLIFSNSHGLDKLHSLTVARILDEYMDVLNKNPNDYTSFYILSSLTGCINIEMLTQEQINRIHVVRGLAILKPLRGKFVAYKKLQKRFNRLEERYKTVRTKLSNIRKSGSYKLASKLSSTKKLFARARDKEDK